MNNALKEQYISLTKDEKRTARKEKFWRRLSGIVTFIIFIFCVVFSVFFLKAIPNPSDKWWQILVIVCKVLTGFVLLIASIFLTDGITYPLWKKVETFNLPKMKKEIYSKACAHLRDYYKLQEPFIITKCYDSTDEKFKNHDVCLFVVGYELRITTDLINGFLYGQRDLGCYVFKRNEINLSKQRNDKLLVLELKADDTVFRLGYRAKNFIEKNFVSKLSDG